MSDNPFALSNIQPGASAPGSASAPAVDDNPFALPNIEAAQRTQRRATMFDAVRVNPDQAAKAKTLERETGTPSDVILRNLQDVEMQAAVEKYSAQIDAQGSNTLRKYYATSDFARMSHDDLNTLLGVDAQVRQYGEFKAWNGPKPTTGSVLYGLAMSPLQGFKAAREGLNMQMTDLLEGLGVIKLDDVTRKDMMRKMAQASGASDFTTPDFESSTARGLYSGGASMLRMTPGLALSVATRSPTPMLASAGLQTEAESYAKYRTRGATPGMAAVGAVGEGAVEVATELLPSKFLTSALGKAGLGEFITGLLAREIPGEQLATVLQDALDTAIANPDKTWAQYLNERPAAAYETLIATVTQSAAMGGISQGVRLLARDQAKMEESERSLASFESLVQLAAESKLRERSPETFAQFVQEAAEQGGAPTAVYVDARALTDALNQAGITDEQLAQVMPDVPAQMANAFDSGGVVEIPIGQALAAAPGTPLEQVLLQNARLDPEGLSRVELDEATKQADRFIEQAAEAIRKDAETKLAGEEQVAQIKQTITEQLNTAGRFRPEANQTYATMVGAFYSTMSQRLGVTPAELYARYPLRVTGEMQAGALEQAAQAVRAEQTMAKSPVTGKPEFALFDAEGNRLGVYRSAATADEAVANFNQRRTVQSQPEPQVRVDAPQPAKSKEPRSNWKIVRGQKFTNLDEDDGYLYHVTSSRAASDIIRSGLVPNSPRTFGNAYAGHSANRVFLTERSGVSFWQEKVEHNLQALYDRPPAVTVVRIPKDKITAQLQPDEIGSVDSRRPAYYAEGEVLAQTDGKFKPVAQQTRATFSPEQMLIALGPNADYSSFLHEMGHAWLEILNDIATQPGAPEQIAKDWQTTLDWFGVTAKQWAGMTLDQKRPYHERWAESTEQYFFEGKAPSTELRGVFDRFRTWLMSVYKSLTRFLAMRAQTPGGQAGAGTLAQSQRFSEDNRLSNLRWDGPAWQRIRENNPALAALTSPNDEVTIYRATIGDSIRPDDFVAVDKKTLKAELANVRARDGKSAKIIEQRVKASDLLMGNDASEFVYYPTSTLAQSDNTAGPLNLTDEIRAVMDRLLATDEQITEMERVRAFGLLFKSPEEAGMTPEQWAAYTSADEKAHAEALTELSKRSLRDMSIVMRKRMRALRDVQRDMAEKRKAVEEEAAAIVDASPIEKAKRALKEAAQPSDAFKAELKAWNEQRKAQSTALAEAVKAELLAANSEVKGIEKGQLLAKNKRQMANETERRLLEWERQNQKPRAPVSDVDMAAIADAFGFPSVEEMQRELVSAFSRRETIDGLTDQMMLERYGDLSQPRGMERAADEAVHNENRARVLAAEMAAVNAANNARFATPSGRTVNAMVAAAKQFAERLVESKKVKDLKPQQHTAAETRAARAAEKALAKGDTEGVIVAKRDQLLNFHAAKATNEARIEAAKVEAFFKKIATAKDDVVSKTRDIDVVKAAQAILAAYGVGTKGKAATEYMAVLEKNDPTMFAALKPSIDAALIGAKPVDELTMGELRALNEELQAMWFLAKRSRQMEVDGNLLDIQEAADDLKARLVEIGIPDTVPGDTSAITPAEQRALKLKGFLAAARRVESWAQAKDGTARGPFRRLVWEPVREAADRYRADKGKTLKAFKALLDPIAPTLTKRKIAAPELNYTFGEDTDGVALAEILHAVLHTGNESNKRKLLLGRKWATETAEGVLDTGKWDAFVQRMVTEGILQPAHFDFAQGVWDLLEQTKPLAQKTHREVFGKYFAEVTADAFTDPFGVKRRGGYVPAQADSRIVSDKAMHDLLESENASMQFAFPSTNKGFTKGRVEYNRPLLLDLRSLTQHIDKVLLFAHMESHVRDVRRLLTNKSVAYGLNRIDPAAFAGVLTPWLNRAAKQQVETPIAGDFGTMRFFSALRRRAGMAAMFGNVANAVQQLAGFSMAAVRVKPGRLASATAQYMAGPREMTASVAAKSTYMATRLENEVSNMNDAINDILLDPSVYEKSKTFLAKHAYFVQSAVDNVMGPIIWTGAYNQALEQGMEDKDAVRYADSTIRETQGSTAPEDISRIEGGNAFVRMFTQFAGYFNMQANLLGTEFKVIARDLGLRKGLGRGLYVLVFGYLVNAWVAEAIMQAFKGGPDDDDKDGDYLDDWLKQVFGWSLVRNTTAMVPVAGQVGTLAVNMFDSKPYNDRMGVSPAISMIESSVKAGVDAYKLAEGKDVKPSNVIRDVATLISMTAGVPATAFAKPLGYVADVQAGKVTPTSPADAVRGTVTGVASPESKR